MCSSPQSSLIRLTNSHIVSVAANPTAARDISHTIGFPIRNILPHSPLPLQIAHQFTHPSLEPTAYTHPELQPGARLLDIFSSRISFDPPHPKKSSDEFSPWLDNLRTFISHLSNSPLMVFGFTDRSARPGTPDVATAAYRLYIGSTLMASSAFVFTEATAYDTEILALAICISRGIESTTTDLHIFADSQSAVQSIFDVGAHSAQFASISLSSKLRRWFTINPAAHLHVHWCPGHVGIAQNELVDQDARNALRRPNPTQYTSVAWVRQHTKKKALAA